MGNELKCFQAKTGDEVFINDRGIDTKENEASLIYHNLRNKGRRVFLDKNSIKVGDRINTSIEQAIRTASVHIANFSPNYADSEGCLNELDSIFDTGAPIIPVFCGVSPSEVRMEEENGPYARAFRRHKEVAKINPQTLQKWRERLCEASNIAGIMFTGDQGEQLERIAECVNARLEKGKSLAVADPLGNRGNVLKCFQSKTGFEVFINHRGTDTKEKEASLIYHYLRNKGRRVFLDKNSIQVGDRINTSIDHAIRTASVHIAIFSPNYADSQWCLSELDLIFDTGAPIIPVFCGVSRSELCMGEENGPYARAFQRHMEVAKINPKTLQKWRERLYEASKIAGIVFTGDQEEQLERIAACVNTCLEKVNSLAVEDCAFSASVRVGGLCSNVFNVKWK